MIPGALMGQHSRVANGQIAIFRPSYLQFDLLPVLFLEDDVVAVGVRSAVPVMMVVGFSAHIHNGGLYRYHGGIFIFDPLADALYYKIKEQGKPNNNQ